MCVVAENGERRSFVVKNACHFFATRLEKLALATPIIIICVKIHASYASRVTGDWTYVSCDRIWLMERRAPGHRYFFTALIPHLPSTSQSSTLFICFCIFSFHIFSHVQLLVYRLYTRKLDLSGKLYLSQQKIVHFKTQKYRCCDQQC